MREIGLPKLSWRWAPCAAFVLGSLSFVTFALLAIPDHIGHVAAEGTSSSLRFGSALARTQAQSGAQAPNDWSGDTTNTASATPSPGVRSLQPSLVAQNADGAFPKRGFTPPLERAEPPPAPPPPQLTPAQQQPQLNVPPPVPVPPPAAEPPPPAAPPPQPELIPQAAPVPAPAEAAPAPAPPASN
jgi:hypothetical protein